jgi:hypothetical protein
VVMGPPKAQNLPWTGLGAVVCIPFVGRWPIVDTAREGTPCTPECVSTGMESGTSPRSLRRLHHRIGSPGRIYERGKNRTKAFNYPG